MGTHGTVGGEFRAAIRTGSYALAMNVARQMPTLSLADALDLTMLAARKEPERYRPMARRFLIRFIAEASPSLANVKRLADALDQLETTSDLPALREEAERALRELVVRLRD